MLLSTVVATILIYVTRPFGFSALPDRVAGAIILQLGVGCGLAAVITRVAAPYLVQRLWDEDRWTIGLQVLWECVEVTLIACAILLVLSARLPLAISPARVPMFVAITALCAVVPMTMRTFLVERWLRQRAERAAAGASSAAVEPGAVRIVGADGAVALRAGELRYVRAEENYVEVV